MGSKTALGRAALRHAASERGASYAAVALLSAALTLLLTSSAPQSTGSHGVASGMRMHHRRLGGGGDAADWMCKHQYAVTTWDRKRVPVCDPALCTATPATLNAPAKGSSAASRRWTPRDDDAYAAASPSVVGWLKDHQVRYVRVMTALQHQLGVFGAAGEIGVHHGKFFAVVAGNAAAAEPLVAIDLFEAQSENYDLSGSGSTANILYPEKLMSLMDATGIPRADVRLVSGNSLTLTASNFTSLGLPAWRMLSVDGGHSLETTLHDVSVAACTVRDGGIVIVDDWFNQEWTGVQEATYHAAHALARLVPFMHGHNKIWMTTPSHAGAYLDAARREFGCVDVHESRSSIGGSALCLLPE
jgi:phage tail protein X